MQTHNRMSIRFFVKLFTLPVLFCRFFEGRPGRKSCAGEVFRYIEDIVGPQDTNRISCERPIRTSSM